MLTQNTGLSAQKSTARPRTIPVCTFSGRFKVLSSDGTHYYDVDALGGTCNCPAGQRGFLHCRRHACRHLLVAQALWETTYEYRWLMAAPTAAAA
jgi:hypothetical protein